VSGAARSTLCGGRPGCVAQVCGSVCRPPVVMKPMSARVVCEPKSVSGALGVVGMWCGRRLDSASRLLLEGAVGSLQPLALDRLQEHCDRGVVALATSPAALRSALRHTTVPAVCVLAYPWESDDPSAVVSPAIKALHAVLAGNQGKVACVVCDVGVLQDSGACRGVACGALVLFGRGGILCPDIVAAGACPLPPRLLSVVAVPCPGPLAPGGAGGADEDPVDRCTLALTWRFCPQEWPGRVLDRECGSHGACLWEVLVTSEGHEEVAAGMPAREDGFVEACHSVFAVAGADVGCGDKGAASSVGAAHACLGAACTGDHCARVAVPSAEGTGPDSLVCGPGVVYQCSVRSVDLSTSLCSPWVRVNTTPSR
jgi:hypothetical protein